MQEPIQRKHRISLCKNIIGHQLYTLCKRYYEVILASDQYYFTLLYDGISVLITHILDQGYFRFPPREVMLYPSALLSYLLEISFWFWILLLHPFHFYTKLWYLRWLTLIEFQIGLRYCWKYIFNSLSVLE